MYDEKDIKKILSRAVELQNRTEGTNLAGGKLEKLSLEEIEEIASESGLSPEYVRQAALEYEGIPIEEPLSLDTGTNSELELIGFAKGKLDQKTWAELRAMIEYHFDSPGKVKRRPHGIIWKAQPKGILKFLHTRKSPAVEVSSSSNKSTIRIKKSLKTYNKILWPFYAVLAGAASLVGIAMVEGTPEPIFFAAGLIIPAKLLHTWFKSKKEKTREKLKDVMEQLQTIITRRYTAVEKQNRLVQEKRINLEQTAEKEEILEENVTGSSREKTS